MDSVNMGIFCNYIETHTKCHVTMSLRLYSSFSSMKNIFQNFNIMFHQHHLLRALHPQNDKHERKMCKDSKIKAACKFYFNGVQSWKLLTFMQMQKLHLLERCSKFECLWWYCSNSRVLSMLEHYNIIVEKWAYRKCKKQTNSMLHLFQSSL